LIVAFRQQFKVGDIFSFPTAASYFGEPIMLLLYTYLTRDYSEAEQGAIASAASGGGREGAKKSWF
jgi:hypothetical protein